MHPSRPLPRPSPLRRRLTAAAALAIAWAFGGAALALTITPATAPNGRPALSVRWTDAAGRPRTALMVSQSAAGPGYLAQLTYEVNGVTRVCAGGLTGYPGDGFVQNHTASGDDRNSLDQSVPGTTVQRLVGAGHAILEYSMPGYSIPDYIHGAPHAIPTTIHWFFADGRSHPVFAICQDARGAGGNLGADTRSPYGSLNYDGSGRSDVGGASYGDTLQFVTLASHPEKATIHTPWRDTAPNSIPYAMQWADPAQADAEMGHVATLPLSAGDQGADRGDAAFTDARGVQAPAGPLLQDGSWAFQILDYLLDSGGGALPVAYSKLAWGGNFGRLGGFDNYSYGGSSLDVTQYSRHSDSKAAPFSGSRADGMLMAYSVFVVLGTHSGSLAAGTVAQEVAQMENAAAARLTAAVGAVPSRGPAGVGAGETVATTYSPAGYNPTYSAWEISAAAGDAVDATLTPAAGRVLDHPVFVVTHYNASTLPTSLSVGTGLTRAGVDYYASVDLPGRRLWVTVNRPASTPVRLQVNASAPAAPALSVRPFGTGSTSGVSKIQISWPSSAVGFVLQQAARVQGSAWSPVGLTPSDDGVTKSVVVPLTPGTDSRFYRLGP